MRGPGRLDTGGGLIARSARGIDRLLTGGSRREQLALPIKITLRVPGDGQGLIEGLLRLRNLLRPQPAAQFVEVCLCGRYGGVGGRERFLERLRVESRHMCARLDMIAFLQNHMRDAARPEMGRAPGRERVRQNEETSGEPV